MIRKIKNNYDDVAIHQASLLKRKTAYRLINNKFRNIPLFIVFIGFIAGLYFNYTVGFVILSLAILNFTILTIIKIQVWFYHTNSNKHETRLSITDDLLPTFTILLPMKNEGERILETLKTIENIQYPPDKMQVIVIIEKNDKNTHSQLNQISLPSHFEILNIPVKPPFTKGRALLYGLNKATGKYITVYDAESRPEQLQFLLAVEILEKANGPICLQAIIRIKNHKQNFITRFFTSEYIEWYERYLAFLSESRIPFGLGGNSFFINTNLLREAGGWDPFNVTEDADLGVRLMKSGVSLRLLNSVTTETCPDTVYAWMRQRIRWMKGLLVTVHIHLNEKRLGINKISFKNWLSYWTSIISGTMQPFFIVFILLYFIITFFIDKNQSYRSFLYFTGLLLIINFLLSYYLTVFSNIRNGTISFNPWNTVSSLVGVLLYWGMYCFAGVLSYGEFILDPIKWHKTDHESIGNNRKKYFVFGFKNYYVNSLIAIGAVLVITVEIILRNNYFEQLKSRIYPLIYTPDRLVGYTLIPNAEAKILYPSQNNTIKLNNQGFIGNNFSVKKKSGTFRILHVGTSIENTYGIKRENNYAMVLQKLFNEHQYKVEFINASVDGGRRSLLNFNLIKYKYSKYEPDLIIFSDTVPFEGFYCARENYKGHVISYSIDNLKSREIARKVIDNMHRSGFFTKLYDISYIIRACCRKYLENAKFDIHGNQKTWTMDSYINNTVKSSGYHSIFIRYSIEKTINEFIEVQKKLSKMHAKLILENSDFSSSQFKSKLMSVGIESIYLNINDHENKKPLAFEHDGHPSEYMHYLMANRLYSALQPFIPRKFK